MASPKKISLGVFAAGEIPLPVVHAFKYADGDPIPLTTYTPTVYIEGPEGVNAGQGTLTVVDAMAGTLSYTWHEDDMQTPGKYRMLLWIEAADESTRFASDLITFEVYDGPGPTPS